VPVCGQAQPDAQGRHALAFAAGCQEPAAHSVGEALGAGQLAPGGQPRHCAAALRPVRMPP
jgi:hypothetical protein